MTLFCYEEKILWLKITCVFAHDDDHPNVCERFFQPEVNGMQCKKANSNSVNSGESVKELWLFLLNVPSLYTQRYKLLQKRKTLFFFVRTVVNKWLTFMSVLVNVCFDLHVMMHKKTWSVQIMYLFVVVVVSVCSIYMLVWCGQRYFQ